MIRDFKHNDLVLNFYRGIAYRLTSKFNKYGIDLHSRCRLTDFEEEQRFNSLKSDVVPLVKIVGENGSKWSKFKKHSVEFTVNNRVLRMFRDISKEYNTTDYSELISLICAKLESPETEQSKDQTIQELKAKIKQQNAILNAIKNELIKT